jgi:hypothetical protein
MGSQLSQLTNFGKCLRRLKPPDDSPLDNDELYF